MLAASACERPLGYSTAENMGRRLIGVVAYRRRGGAHVQVTSVAAALDCVPTGRRLVSAAVTGAIEGERA